MAAARPRRLPARVYWFRRGLVLVVVLALVGGVAHLLGVTDGDAPAPDRATVAAAPGSSPEAAPETAPAPALPQYGPLEAAKVRPRQVRSAEPAVPTGPCRAEDLVAVPSAAVGEPTDEAEQPGEEPGEETVAETSAHVAEAGRPIAISLALQGTQPACTFEVGPRSVAVKVTTEDGAPFWSSQTCSRRVPRESVVVRSAEPTTVSLTWNARDSQAGCGNQAAWAMPGFYRLHATVQGSTPTEVPFELVLPSDDYRTATPEPRPRGDRANEPGSAEAPAPDPAPEAPTPSPAPTASPDR